MLGFMIEMLVFFRWGLGKIGMATQNEEWNFDDSSLNGKKDHEAGSWKSQL